MQPDPTHDEEAEAAILGAILLENRLIWDVMVEVHPEDFYVLRHEKIFFAMIDTAENGDGKIDIVSLRSALEGRGELRAVGGATALSRLLDSVPDVANVMTYVKIVKACALNRTIAKMAPLLADTSRPPRERAMDVLGKMYLALEIRDATSLQTISQLSAAYTKDQEAGLDRRWVESGIENLDRLVTMRRRNVIVIAGNPGTGKSALALQISTRVAKTGHVLFVTLEMSEREVLERAVQAKTGCSAPEIENPKFTTTARRAEINAAFEELREYGHTLHILNPGMSSPQDVLAIARSLQLKHGGLSLVVIDYLQLMHCTEKNMSPVERVTWLSRQVKAIARQLDVPIVLLSQLSRGQVKDNREPQLHDLRDSGAIEQDADIVIFSHRPDQESDDGMLIVRKQRHGPTGVCYVKFDKQRCLFRSIQTGY